jgi:hypothetical protein
MMSVLLVWGVRLSAAAENLLPNGSFEDYSCNALGCSFENWSFPLGCGTASTSDKIDGEVALHMMPTFESTLDNAVSLTDEYYAAGTVFNITLNYKVTKLPKDGFLKLDCYWEPSASGDADEIHAHDADELQSILTEVAAGSWESTVLSTSKPANSSRLRVRIIIPKKATVLFDDFRVEENTQAADEPYIRVSPVILSAVSTTIGNTVDFKTLHIEQGNTTGTTTFELSGYNPEMFRISATSMPSDKKTMDLTVTYAPTQSGTHSAVLNIDNINHTTLFQSIKLTGTCTDPSKAPSITIEPSVLPDFEAIEGMAQTNTFTVVSENCQDFVYLHVDHIKGAAFTVNTSMAVKNGSCEVTVRFAPQEAGEFQSIVTAYSEGVKSATIKLNGKGIKRSKDNIDWLTEFVWDDSHPMKLMNETFDNASHNQTLKVDGWQNVAPLEERPWWGFDEAQTSPVRGDGKYAKATAYQYGKDSSAIWESWLVTPALDYKNAEGKIFAFSVMGEYLPEDGISSTGLEFYYVAQVDDKVAFQNLTESFSFPYASEDDNIWRTYFLNLEPYEESIADVFHIAFRYVGPNGGAGVVTYYIDDVSWGRTDLPQIVVNPSYIIDSTSVVGEKKKLATIEVTGKNLTNDIWLGLAGANYTRFDLSVGTLPATGGTFDVSFEGQAVGVHEAYIVLSSKNAPDTFIPMAVRCNSPQGIESIQDSDISIQTQKILRDGNIYILRDGKMYTIIGHIVKQM